MNILITGAEGFIGRNCVEYFLSHGHKVVRFGKSNSLEELRDGIASSDIIIHAAGSNRPKQKEDFYTVNQGLTALICRLYSELKSSAKIIFTSSIHVERHDDYGESKLLAEKELRELCAKTSADVSILRLQGVFGKWSKPNYNSVVSTFCWNVVNGMEPLVSNKEHILNLIYIDDLVLSIYEIATADTENGLKVIYLNDEDYEITVGELAEKLKRLQHNRSKGIIPDMSDSFTKKLNSTLISFDKAQKSHFHLFEDERGSLFEVLKSESFGQIFISRTNPGITRGNHYHNLKVERFIVLEGEAKISLRELNTEIVQEIFVSGSEPCFVEITPGCTHNIENIGTNILTTLFWANEIFNPENADTYFKGV